MRKLLALTFAILTVVAFGCDRGFPDEAPPTGKNEMNAATSKTSLFGPTRPNVSFSSDIVVETDAGEEEEEE
jgi:hypothetical protein